MCDVNAFTGNSNISKYTQQMCKWSDVFCNPADYIYSFPRTVYIKFVHIQIQFMYSYLDRIQP